MKRLTVYIISILLSIFLFFEPTMMVSKEKNKNRRLNKTKFTPNLDWKMHNIGNFSLQITNFGMIGGDNDFFVHPQNFISCEYPLNSGIAHLEGGGIWIGAIIDTSSVIGVKKEIRKVTTGYEGWGGDGYSTGGGGLLNEMYPGNSSNDSILNITSNSQKPAYWNSYYGNLNFAPVSDQDFLCQYNDTILPSSDPIHVPLGIKIIQRSMSWKSNFMEGIIFIQYQIINLKKNPLRDVYAGFFMDMDVGPISAQKESFGFPRNYWEDNYAAYRNDIKLAFIDNPLDKPSTPLGLCILKSSEPMEKLKFSFSWYSSEQSPDPDSKRYEILAGNYIMPDQSITQLSDTRFLIGMGPFNFTNSDTITILTALIGGNSVSELSDKHRKAKNVLDDNYFVPNAPNSPDLSLSKSGKGINLNWQTPGSNNPEDFRDYTNITARNNYDGRIFEGYRIYRAEKENPAKKDFVLLREFDKPGNKWGFNTGLKYQFIDTNIVPGRTYSYSVTSFSIEDTSENHFRESIESSPFENLKTITAPYFSGIKNNIGVVPNPYRADGNYTQGVHWEGTGSTWTENNRLIRFINLPEKCEIRIFTVNGELIKTIAHDDAFNNWANWNLQTNSGRTIGSGIYIYNVKSNDTQFTGKFVVIK